MENISQMSMLEVAIKVMEQKEGPQPINQIIEETLELKGIDKTNVEAKTQLYVDITTSSKFVYMGDENWDLKIRQSLDEWDKDGSAFNTQDIEDDDDDIDVDDYNNEDSSSDEDEEDETSEYDDTYDEEDYSRPTNHKEDDEDSDEYDEDEEDSDSREESDFDEEDYDQIMDDYEDLYGDDK